jgi:hypothetical protein
MLGRSRAPTMPSPCAITIIIIIIIIKKMAIGSFGESRHDKHQFQGEIYWGRELMKRRDDAGYRKCCELGFCVSTLGHEGLVTWCSLKPHTISYLRLRLYSLFLKPLRGRKLGIETHNFIVSDAIWRSPPVHSCISRSTEWKDGA